MCANKLNIWFILNLYFYFITIKKKIFNADEFKLEEECIPVVRCSSHLLGGVSASVHAGIHTPQGLDPHGMDLPGLDPPGLDLGTLHPLGLGLDNPPSGQTDTCENITFANFVCGR